MANIKIFEVAEDEWIAAESAEDATAFYKHLAGEATYEEIREEFGEPVELSPEVLARLRWCDHDVEPPHCVTFAERLTEVLAENGTFPQAFASCL